MQICLAVEKMRETRFCRVAALLFAHPAVSTPLLRAEPEWSPLLDATQVAHVKEAWGRYAAASESIGMYLVFARLRVRPPHTPQRLLCRYRTPAEAERAEFALTSTSADGHKLYRTACDRGAAGLARLFNEGVAEMDRLVDTVDLADSDAGRNRVRFQFYKWASAQLGYMTLTGKQRVPLPFLLEVLIKAAFYDTGMSFREFQAAPRAKGLAAPAAVEHTPAKAARTAVSGASGDKRARGGGGGDDGGSARKRAAAGGASSSLGSS